MSIGLKAGKASFITAMSHAPYDSLRDLIKALSALLGGENEVIVKWNREPEEYDFEMHRNGNDAEFNIVRYPNHRRLKKSREIVFSHKASVVSVCESFSKALSDLHTDKEVDEFDKNWRREFPEAEMRELTTQLRTTKRRKE